MSSAATRLRSLQERLPGMELDGLLVSARANVRYLSGFTGSNGWLLVRAGEEPVLLTDGRYREQADVEAPGCRTRIATAGLVGALAEELTSGSSVIGAESDDLTVTAYGEITERCAAARWTPVRGVVEGQRRRKEPGEVEKIRRALRLAEAVLAEVAGGLGAGATEGEVAATLEFECRRRGATTMAFDTIVASGPRGALPHARPGGERIPEGSPTVVDLGCVLDGYCSDITRCVVLGPALERDWEPVWAAVAEARGAAIEAIEPGVACRDVDRAARARLEAEGLGDAFVHGTGHGVGLEVHEAPRLSPTSDDVLEEGMVVTIEPGVYLPGRGGIRLEDLVLVTASGGERLNRMAVDPIGPELPPDR